MSTNGGWKPFMPNRFGSALLFLGGFIAVVGLIGALGSGGIWWGAVIVGGALAGAGYAIGGRW